MTTSKEPMEADKEQPDIDDILDAFGGVGHPKPIDKRQAKLALYQRLAAEADLTWKKDGGDEEYISVTKLKAIMEIKDAE